MSWFPSFYTLCRAADDRLRTIGYRQSVGGYRRNRFVRVSMMRGAGETGARWIQSMGFSWPNRFRMQSPVVSDLTWFSSVPYRRRLECSLKKFLRKNGIEIYWYFYKVVSTEHIWWFTDAFDIRHTPFVHFEQRFLCSDIDAGQFAGVDCFVRQQSIKRFLENRNS